jgi:hypothetical protein
MERREYSTIWSSKYLKASSLAVLLAALGYVPIASRSPIRDADVWWHLRVGQWILANGEFPHSGIFSRTAADRTWAAYSWGYEILLAKFYAWFGITGIAWFGVLMVVGAALVFFWALHRVSNRFWISYLLCAVGGLACLYNVLPRPVFFSMMFFAVVLVLLHEANESGRSNALWLLPPVFALWANFHIQFIYGLIVVGIVTVINAAQQLLGERLPKRLLRRHSTPPVRLSVFAWAASLLACCIGPYSYHLYGVVLSYAKSKFPYEYLQEFQPIDFKHPSDYFLAAITISAIIAVVRKKHADITSLAVLAIGTALACRGVRDAWFLAISAGIIVADAYRSERSEETTAKAQVAPGFIACVLLASSLFVIAVRTHFTERELDRTISSEFPVDAVNILRRNPFPGPIYNDFGWGGFLIWYMPDHPVSIDGRTDLYGDDMDLMNLKTVSGDYESDPYFRESGIVLLPIDAPLCRRQLQDERFRLVYQNGISMVFVRNHPTEY